MVTTNLQDVLFKVDLSPVYTVVKKKPELFAGYAVVNLDENKVLKTVSDRYELRTNEVLISEVKQFYPLSFDFAHFDNKKSHFHIYFTIPTKVTGQWQWAIEIINAYDCKTAPKKNVAFKHIISGYYTFTNKPVINDLSFTEVMDILKNTDASCLCKYNTPFPSYIYQAQKSETVEQIDVLAGIELWRQKSHQLARNWLAESVDNLLAKEKINGISI